MVWKGKVETILVSILITLTQTAVASGIITVQLVEYDHRDGKDADGKCCESIWSSGCKANECDPYFDLCLKNRTNGKEVPRITTDRTTNVGHIHFGNNIGTTTNNIVLNFIGPLSDLDLNIKVFDSDSDGTFDKKDDLIEILAQRVQLSPTIFSQQPSAFSDLQLNGARTSISLRYRAVCDQYYYGQECDIMCNPHPNHYICDDHGNKLCIANWTGPKCDIQTDNCWCSPCLNGGTCKDGNMTYTCTCLSDYAGQDCELSLPTSTTTTALQNIANSTTRTETALYTIASSTTRTTTVLHTNANSTTRTTTALHTIANSTRTTTALHTTTNSTTSKATALHTNTNSTTSTATDLYTNANSTSRTTNALHNNDNLTTTTTATITLPSMTSFKKTTMSKNSLMNASSFQIFTRLPNVTATLTPVRQSGMHINFSTTIIILQSDYQEWSPTIRFNHVTISEARPPTVSIHGDPDVMTLLTIVGGAIAGTGVLLALCGLLTSYMKRRQNMMAELHKNNEDIRKLAWT